jgi:hypothetical protein
MQFNLGLLAFGLIVTLASGMILFYLLFYID